MFAYLAKGLILGGAAAAQPGPFQAYLLGQTLKNGWKRTLAAAFAPLISDGPIIVLVVFLLTHTPPGMLIILRLLGGVFLLYLAANAFFGTKPSKEKPSAGTAGQSLLHAALMNLLNPNPYIFWATVAGPIFLEGWRETPGQGLSFILGFYGTLIGGFMICITMFATIGRLGPMAHYRLGLFSAAVLFGFGVYLLVQGSTGAAEIVVHVLNQGT